MDTIDLFNKVYSMGIWDRVNCFEQFMEYSIRKGDIRLVKYLNERFNNWINDRVRFDWVCLAEEYDELEIKEYLCLELAEHLRP